MTTYRAILMITHLKLIKKRFWTKLAATIIVTYGHPSVSVVMGNLTELKLLTPVF